MSRRSEDIAGVMMKAIGTGEWAVGARLPSERDLTVRFGASRVVIREALAGLRISGLITSRRGAGAFVAARRPTETGVPLVADGLGEILDCLELRRAVEVEAASLAAARRRPAQLARVEAALAMMVADVGGGRSSSEADWQFHVAIAEATGNAFFPRVMAAFGPDAIPRHKLAVSKIGQDRMARERDLLAEHRAILAALLAGNPEAAAGAMRRHLDRALARYRLATTQSERGA